MATLEQWADAEMIDELKRLEEVDCLRLDVWVGGKAQSSRDASHYLPRLLELAEIGLFSLKDRSDPTETGRSE